MRVVKISENAGVNLEGCGFETEDGMKLTKFTVGFAKRY
jgi:hypothetical protein